MGWLGWTWSQIEQVDVNTLQLALDGRTELLGMIFGKGEHGGKRPGGPITRDRWEAFAANNNRRYVGPQRGRRNK